MDDLECSQVQLLGWRFKCNQAGSHGISLWHICRGRRSCAERRKEGPLPQEGSRGRLQQAPSLSSPGFGWSTCQRNQSMREAGAWHMGGTWMGTSTHVKSRAMAQQLAQRMRMRARLREGSMHRRSPSDGSLSLPCRGAVLLSFSD